MVREIITSEDLEEVERVSLNEIIKGRFDPVKEEEKFGAFNKLLNYKFSKEERAHNRPWSNHNKVTIAMPYLGEVSEWITLMAKKRLKYATICAVLYLTASRVSEVLGRKFKDGTVYEGIRWRDLVENIDESGMEWIHIRTIVEKRNENWNIVERGSKYKFILKLMKIPINKEYLGILDVIKQYADKYPNRNPEDLVFPKVHSRTFARYLNRNWGLSCHSLRHFRCSHLVNYHGLTESELREKIQWDKKSLMPMTYIHVDEQIIDSKMKNMKRYD